MIHQNYDYREAGGMTDKDIEPTVILGSIRKGLHTFIRV